MTFVMLRCDRCRRLAETLVTTGELVADAKQTCGTRPELVCADCSAWTTGEVNITIGAVAATSAPSPAASLGKGSEGAPSNAAPTGDAPPATAPGPRSGR